MMLIKQLAQFNSVKLLSVRLCPFLHEASIRILPEILICVINRPNIVTGTTLMLFSMYSTTRILSKTILGLSVFALMSLKTMSQIGSSFGGIILGFPLTFYQKLSEQHIMSGMWLILEPMHT